MVSFGVVKLQADLASAPRMLGKTAPISHQFRTEALQTIGVSREEHLNYEAPSVVMPRLVTFLSETSKGRPIAISDNPAYDFAFLNLYLHRYCGNNPLGYSARRIGDFYAGVHRELRRTNDWKNLRCTQHDHNPLNDALGNAEAFLTILREHKVKFQLE
jgi:hypothetical protein